MNKVEFIEIPENKLPEYIYLSYQGDDELLDKFPTKKDNILEALDYEVNLIKETAVGMSFKYYKVMYAKIAIGYLVAFEDFIFSFCISIKYRTKQILIQWMDMMVYFFGGGLKFGVLSNNERAIKFFKRYGMKISWQSEDENEYKELLLTF